MCLIPEQKKREQKYITKKVPSCPVSRLGTKKRKKEREDTALAKQIC
jgi:hypothetical protein